MNPAQAIVLYRIVTERFSDVDIYNAIVSKIDEYIFNTLGLYLSYEAYRVYEAIYNVLGLNDMLKWLRGEEISINSIIAYIFTVIAWMV